MKVLFLDRDGTLIHEPDGGYIDSIDKFNILPHVITSLQKLQFIGYKLIMISNQPGLGTAKFPYENFIVPQNELMKIFKDNKIFFEKTYFCPHFRENNCSCMKPRTGLIEGFIKSNNVEVEKSYTVGDRDSDVLLAKNIGCKNIFFSNKTHTGSVFNSHDWSAIADYILNEN
ncbi:histidinol-phosphatase [Candidatus Roizmanbacteria bacterium CG_4_10_14_0_8_um_filter_39_9]|uniref:D,D-heptose 1,7-bisphosphate phosphatase n=1 Tax=Candidatus Roizmanbacteria bacterium CG_4_10_14_0_8_um_filter_39_9 TaxID=1974829 RepID=A0A2M7QBM4_9BACT|nr:MAG: histidinol-phosphatase [Candidatus Roizmanbacteria bacterium CG_4_10_14_0_8_um_filter_39_9]